jgi:diguanylate cyclase (GGDEF)-like protein
LFVVWQSGNVVRGEDGRVTHHVCGLTDITAYRTEADRVAWLAQHDQLTGLPNRTLLTDRLCQAIRQARRNRSRLAIIFIDLDKFKPVNDTLGHAIGDLLLKAVAERLLGCLRDSDSVARQGGDEFVVLLPVVEDMAAVLQVAEKIRMSLRQTFVLSAHVISIGASSGVAIFPDHGADESQLMQCADDSMYQAKAAGGDRVALWASCVMPSGTPAVAVALPLSQGPCSAQNDGFLVHGETQ